MPTFDWQSSAAEANIDSWVLEPWQILKRRFDTAFNAEGVDQWTVFVESVQELAGQSQTFEWQAEVYSRLATLVRQLRGKPAPRYPTLFVSQRCNDRAIGQAAHTPQKRLANRFSWRPEQQSIGGYQ